MSASSLASLAMVGMSLACLPCAWHLWRAATPSVWRLTATLDAGMLLVHCSLPAVAPHAMHGGGGGASGVMLLGTCLVAAQLALAGATAWRSLLVARAR